MTLFGLDTPEDLACRGFGQDEILERTGVDTGYHTNKLRSVTKGVDRLAYKREHVLTRLSEDVVESVLSRYGDAELDVVGVLSELGLANPTICKLKKLFAGTCWENAFRDADRRYRKHNMASGFAATHDGVDNPFKLDEYQEQAARTRERLYGGAYTLSEGSSKAEAARATFVEHMADEEFKADVNAKRRATMFERYGVEYLMQSDAMKAKARETCVERYGVEHWAKTEEARAAQSERAREHGCEWAEKAKETCLERYGVDSWSKTDEARAAQSERMRESMVERFDKMRETMLERYGVVWGGQTEAHHEAMHRVWDERREELIESIREANVAKYGVPYYSQTEEARLAQSERMRLDGKRRAEVARERSLFGSSSVEEFLRSALVSRFGEDDVEWQFSSDERYPFACDFYVRSRDLFVELNGTWTHGGHWFDEHSSDDAAKVELWRGRDTDYYRNAIENWCERDVRKREAARSAKLNYVVLWDGSADCADARLWLAMGCPDGRDWEREYSWLPERELRVDVDWPEELKAGTRCCRQVAQAANGNLLWARELELWQENRYMRTWGTAQAWLYANRLRYLRSGEGGRGQWEGPTPDEVTDMQLLRGFGISGLVRSYSTFDNKAMVDFIGRYGVGSVYDPCAGWGERLATCAALGVGYRGCDVRPELVEGYGRIVSRYGIDDVVVTCGDAAKNDVRDFGHDAVFTCPPYGDIEVYSDAGAENLDSDAFADWWAHVCKMSVGLRTRWFAVQTNQAMRDVFSAGIEACGFSFVEEIGLNAGRRPWNLGKQERECVLVFGRKV